MTASHHGGAPPISVPPPRIVTHDELVRVAEQDACRGKAGKAKRPKAAVIPDSVAYLEPLPLAGSVYARATMVLDWLAAHNAPPRLYTQGGRLVTMRVIDDPTGPTRVIVPLDNARVADHVGSRVRLWQSTGKDEWQEAELGRAVCEAILARPAYPPEIPPLHGIARTPYVAPSGRIVDRAGYDPETGMYLDLSGRSYHAVPEAPSAADVGVARAIMDDLVIDFPFADDASRAHALAFLLGFFLRPHLPAGEHTPLHLVTAAQSQTGKTLLVEALTLAATGAPPTAVCLGRDEESRMKALGAALADCPAAICFDNVSERYMLDSPGLAAAITSDPIRWRRLQVSELVASKNNVMWAMTGNNPKITTELANRCALIRLDRGVERPQEFDRFRHPEIKAYARARHADCAWAALTLYRAWHAAGRCGPDVKTGNFRGWAHVIGGILAHAGVTGMLANRAALASASDTEHAAYAEFVAAWWARHEGAHVSASALLAGVCDGLEGITAKLGDGGQRSQTVKLGQVLDMIDERIFDGLRVRRGQDKKSKSFRYWLEKVETDAQTAWV